MVWMRLTSKPRSILARNRLMWLSTTLVRGSKSQSHTFSSSVGRSSTWPTLRARNASSRNSPGRQGQLPVAALHAARQQINLHVCDPQQCAGLAGGVSRVLDLQNLHRCDGFRMPVAVYAQRILIGREPEQRPRYLLRWRAGSLSEGREFSSYAALKASRNTRGSSPSARAAMLR